MEQIVYYKTFEDDFEKKVDAQKIDGSYKYLHKNIFWNIFSFIVYRLVATPIAYLYMKLKFGLKFENRKLLKIHKNKGYFLYINHTQPIGDAFMPTLLNFPKKTYVMVHPSNVSLPFWGNIIKFLGPLPIPGDLESGRNFVNAIDELISKKKAVVIYPEAHVWKYYTKIRPYKASSFKYPIKFDAPAFAITVTYKERKNKSPKMVAYVDGPFYPDENLLANEKRENLKNKVYEIMKKRAKNSDIEYIKYVKVEENE